MLGELLCRKSAMRWASYYSASIKETQRRTNGFLRSFVIYQRCFLRIKRIGFAIPQTPVVVERRRVKRTGNMMEHIGQLEVRSVIGLLTTAMHDAYMRQKVALKVKTRKVHAVSIAFDEFEEGGSDTLGCFAMIVSWKHAVDIRFVAWPKTPPESR